MNKIKILSKPAFFVWFTLIYGVALVGFAIFQISAKPGFTYTSDLQGYLNLLLAVIFIGQHIFLKRYDRFFIKIEGNEIEWLLPNMDHPMRINKSELVKLDASWKGVEIKTRTEEIFISFKEYEWNQGKKIRETFKEFAT